VWEYKARNTAGTHRVEQTKGRHPLKFIY
jgi:hypothetical protein